MNRASHFLLVEAERYRHLAQRTRDETMAALFRRAVAEHEDLARRHDEYCGLDSFGVRQLSNPEHLATR